MFKCYLELENMCFFYYDSISMVPEFFSLKGNVWLPIIKG